MEKKGSGSARLLWNRLRNSVRSCRVRLRDVKSYRYRSLGSFHSSKMLSRKMGSNVAETDQMLKEFYIPDYILVPNLEAEKLSYVPKCPIIVFINSKSGGQLGGNLLTTYRELLNKDQVFDLGEEAPDKVLHGIYSNLEKLKSSGDDLAAQLQNNLRLIVAGGDGTASWLLGVVSDLKLPHPPPIATVPLGTGNNLPYSFGWGKKNPGTDRQAVESFLHQVLKARVMKIDSWHIIMRMRVPNESTCDPIAPLELPQSLHAFHRISHTDELNVEGYHTFRGGFWNYFSMDIFNIHRGRLLCTEANSQGHKHIVKEVAKDGFDYEIARMDAQVSYAFHSERKLHPEKFKNQLVNQTTYAKLGCTQGWFCASLLHPSSRNIAQLAKVKILKRHGHWEDLRIPSSIRSIICLNLPSFSGGLNPWGTPNPRKTRDRDLTPPYVDDGLIEVVGFRDAWHGLVLLAPKGHGTRLAQARKVRFEFHKGAADCTYMRIDGEPWKQPLPENDDTVTVEISHLGQVNMLAAQHCIAKSVYDPSTPSAANSHYDDEDSGGEDSDEEWEERRKFGAADTFRLPEDVDIAHLS